MTIDLSPATPMPDSHLTNANAADGFPLKEWVLAAAVAGGTFVVWLAVGDSYFWPMWVWLGLAIPLALSIALPSAWSAPPGPRRRLAVHAALSAIAATSLLLTWAMAGAGYFWPIFAWLGLAGLFLIHAMLDWPPRGELSGRVDELARTRRGALDVQAAELRRIERDLHDGAQARLVALSIQLGRAEERLEDRPEEAALVRHAREEAAAAIGELRDLARGIAPPVLADRGLTAAVGALAQRAQVPVSVQSSGDRRAPAVVETAAYFVVAEALTNAIKHGGGAGVRITIAQTADELTVQVRDEGPGGADPSGSGLTGLRQRVEALDGVLTVRSPAGEGTTVRAVLPCGW